MSSPTVAYEEEGYSITVQVTSRRSQRAPFNLLPRCPKCGSPSWAPILTKRSGKNPESLFVYWCFKHRKDGRTGRNRQCYVPASGPERPHLVKVLLRLVSMKGVYVRGLTPEPSFPLVRGRD